MRKFLKELLQAIVFITAIVGVAFCIMYATVHINGIVGAILAFLMLIGLLNYLFDKRVIKSDTND